MKINEILSVFEIEEKFYLLLARQNSLLNAVKNKQVNPDLFLSRVLVQGLNVIEGEQDLMKEEICDGLVCSTGVWGENENNEL
jgi:hypothetical protein